MSVLRNSNDLTSASPFLRTRSEPVYKEPEADPGSPVSKCTDGALQGRRTTQLECDLRESVQPLQRAATAALNTTQQTLRRTYTYTQEQSGPTSRAERRVTLGGGLPCPNQTYASNSIKTSKYNILTFLPVFLYEMFSRVAYLYFLFQAALSWWEVVSPMGGAGSTMALLFVLLVAGVKAVAEDVKRHREDKITNNTSVHVMRPDGSCVKVRWRDVRVGNIVKVEDDELIPADLLCLHSELPDNVCFVKTTNLDGESNLKIRRPLQLRELIKVVRDLGPGGLVHIKGILQCELPNADLHNFKGRFSWIDENNRPNLLPVTMNEILLRGTLLKNSGAVYGLVVYTGEETRLQQNNAKVPFKNGAYNKFLNLQISLVGFMQFMLCAFFAVMAYTWKEVEGSKRYYFAFDVFVEGNYRNPAVYIVINFLTFWILESYMVPISLFVTVEIVKFWQGFVFVNKDPAMVCPETGEGAKCRNSNLMEDLGKIDYVFSDKTGTLTCNDMRMRQIAVKGVVYGQKEVKLESDAPQDDCQAAMEIFDPNMSTCLQEFRRMTKWERWAKSGGSSNNVLRLGSQHRLSLQERWRLSGEGPARQGSLEDSGGSGQEAGTGDKEGACSRQWWPGDSSSGGSDDGEEARLARTPSGLDGLHLIDFWTNICVCHSLIVETDPDTGEKSVQGPSPDEVALVNCARQLGFTFVGRDVSSIYLDLQGEKLHYEILNVLEFTSDRRRMSVIARSPDGTIRLFTKGADATILGLVNQRSMDESLAAETQRNLHKFARQGLRTLCLGTKVLSEEEWRAWDAKYQDAAADMGDRDQKTATVAGEIEKDLEFVGITAIEDKLQDGVPECIATLLDAGIRVWMITGDKRETAINIAVSCRLLKSPGDALVCAAESLLEASQVLEKLLAEAQQLPEDEDIMKSNSRVLVRNSDGPNGFKASARPATAKELVIDGPTLSHILGTELEPKLAKLGSLCASVVVCRASPSQKASIVRMMKSYEKQQAASGARRLKAWYRRFQRDIQSKMLAIGDGANDVAMIQAADVGVGIMGKEGRQAVNNSDYAFAQFRFLARLLLVHGQLSDYRIAYLIKYSFYKNICFAAVLSYYQFFNGFSGTTVIDDITAFMYNVVFTSMPIGVYSLFDRTMSDTMLLMHPRTYNSGNYLTTMNFWKTGILQGVLDGAIIFFIPFLGCDPHDVVQLDDIGSISKMVFIGLLGSVTLEVALAARYWTYIFAFFVFISYLFIYPFIYGYSMGLKALDMYEPEQNGVMEHIVRNPNFWFAVILVNLCTSGHRILFYCVTWAFFPSDTLILSEKEHKFGAFYEVGWQTIQRLLKIGEKIPEEILPEKASQMPSIQTDNSAYPRHIQLTGVGDPNASTLRVETPQGRPLTPATLPVSEKAVSRVGTPDSALSESVSILHSP
eukprot:CAMPEP_0177598192 /NCGR_PEP_ID=MMETSP0419_2-20121207/12185_1 /TAXON_ID=582737 /ORGANISM="Tetraselmis sp., Strain GSL018" /LENGTH=1412 /DNA_ID=CAMNT_0019090555 /DNA_START=264 /DNA_END=4502 /DNA_ORIENTATION=-